jgi:hypothetical protein
MWIPHHQFISIWWFTNYKLSVICFSLGISKLQFYYFVFEGYIAQVCKVVNIHRVASCCIGIIINRGEIIGNTNLSTPLSSPPPSCWEDRATPCHLGIRFSGFLGKHPPNPSPQFLFFRPIQKKPKMILGFLVFAIGRLHQSMVLVVGRVTFAFPSTSFSEL